MKVLWVCNLALPEIAQKLNMEASNKEGWVSGLIHALLCGDFVREKLAALVAERAALGGESVPVIDGEEELQLQVAFPAPAECCDGDTGICSGVVTIEGKKVDFFGFLEDVRKPEKYDTALEGRMKRILELAKPDMVHCFGTEYPHTLAMCRVFPDKDRILIGIQGLCAVYARAYYADLPEDVISTRTLRDILRQDTLKQQQKKFYLRGINEVEAIKLAGNITGRTHWDKAYSLKWNSNARYFLMNENLRAPFYETQWKEEDCVPHSIFISQGDYPIKGLHYMLLALPGILEKYPDTVVSVAGNSLVEYRTFKQKLKISAYGKYLKRLIEEHHLEKHVKFLGRLSGEEMLKQYLRSHLFVCCSSAENSSNSLGEAMLLGMPCVSADVGGLSSIFEGGKDGILYEGFKETKNNACNDMGRSENSLESASEALKNAILEMWGNREQMLEYCKNARNHARITHDKKINCGKLVEIYAEITNNIRF